MKKTITICFLLLSCIVSAQVSDKFIQELKNLRANENFEKNKVEGFSANVRQAKLSSITAKYQDLESKLRTKYNQIEQQSKQQEELQASINQQQQSQRRQNQQVYDQQILNQMQQKQAQTQQVYQQEISNTLGNLSNSLQAAAYNNVKREIQRREKVATNFARYNSSRIDKVNSLYKQIPNSNFNRNISGKFNAHLFLQRKYSFISNQELVTEIPCLVIVENNKVVDIYPYGKKGFELKYPKEMESASYLSNGIVKYTDFNTLESVTVILLEPYLSNSAKQYSPLEKGTGFITLYTSKSKDEGRTVWVQEIDDKGNIVREISTQLVYAKKESELENMAIKPIPFNTGNELYYFGEPVETPYGTFPLFMKTSKSDTKELDDNENRFVKIKEYRD
jgi:hypothetical protein